MSETNNNDFDIILKRIQEDILPLLDDAILDDKIIFNNPNLKVCWKIKNCEKDACPIYNKEIDLRCWQIAGTYCGGKVQGEFVKKYGNCKKCDIYRAACPTIVEELGEGINNFLHLIRKQNKYTVKQLNEINYLNKELASTLENLDAKNQEIQEIVVTDKLTGLYNRNYLFTVLEDEIYRCQRYNSKLSLMMIDLDDFKSVNDEYGHLVGDKILSALGSFLKLKIRKTDRAFRYGGEELVVILPETEIAIANIIANRIREEYPKQVFTINENDNPEIIEISRTLSIGVTSYKEGCTGQDLLKQADKAMYEAKSQGKNKVIRYDLF